MRLLVPAFSSFFKNKKLKIYIIAISLTFGMIISVLYSMYQFNDIFSDKVKNNIKNRVLYINENYSELLEADIEYISSLENITNMYNVFKSFSMQTEDNTSFNVTYVSKEEIPEVSKGTNELSESEYQVLLPNKTYKGNKAVHLEDLLDKEITLSLEDFSITVKVVGIYEDKNYRNNMYISDAFKEAVIEYNPNVIDSNNYIAIVDDYDNVDKVIKKLKDHNYFSDVMDKSGQQDVKLYNMATLIVALMLAFTIVFTYISISIIIGGIISGEKMDIAILKAIGYRIKDISKIMKYRILAILGISIVIGTIIALVLNQVIFFVINYKLEVSLGNNYIVLGMLLVAFSIAIYIISSIAVKFNNRRIRKINTIELLKEN